MSAADQRRTRLASEYEAISKLSHASGIFHMESAEGDPPTRYTFVFRGNSLAPDESNPPVIGRCTSQHCEVRLPIDFPDSPPEVRWLTPLWHPNVAANGFVDLDDIGLPWSSAAGLDALCERLWDVARFAFINDERVENPVAGNWYQSQQQFLLPVDPRLLLETHLSTNRNIVSYTQRPRTEAKPGPAEIFYIGETTPVEPPPQKPKTAADIVYLDDQ